MNLTQTEAQPLRPQTEIDLHAFGQHAGAELLPGYRLLEPLGRGGFGEVWKCEAPGGLLKAIKIVTDDADRLDEENSRVGQEYQALQQIKDVRHPFLLSTERVDLVNGMLLIVMELADRNLRDLQNEYRATGLPGIPREELLGLMLEAAEVLDLMANRHQLQHLDIKPHNLFLVGTHVKVADFGLVCGWGNGERGGPGGAGLTPLYAAPEVLQGGLSRHSDQYSLAIVYQELLTGTLPFPGTTGRQLFLQHMTAAPNVEPLPESDRAAVQRALTKQPEERFGSCLEFVQALLEIPGRSVHCSTSLALKRPEALRQGMLDLQQHVNPAPETPGALPRANYQLLDRLEEGPRGEFWTVRSPAGRMGLAQMLPGSLGQSAEVAARLCAGLRNVRHPALLPTQVVADPTTGRVTLLSDLPERTLRDRFQEQVERGFQGIWRQELLKYLRAAAEALDELAQRHKLRHLAVMPSNLVLAGDRLLLAGFGQAQLIWLPAGHSAGQFAGRYAAPELLNGAGGPASDQYSLALIYMEMLTGIRPGPRSVHSRRGASRAPTAPDLSLLPAPDRAVLAVALDPDPGARFASCTELIDALEEAYAPALQEIE